MFILFHYEAQSMPKAFVVNDDGFQGNGRDDYLRSISGTPNGLYSIYLKKRLLLLKYTITEGTMNGRIRKIA
jgi:hypothetical protein